MVDSNNSEVVLKAKHFLDDILRQQFFDIPKYLKLYTEPYLDLQGKKILDFGCGKGVSDCAIAMNYNKSTVVGVDIGDDFKNCLSSVRKIVHAPALPENLRFETIKPGDVTSEGDFDLVYSWSVFEHVNLNIMDIVISGIHERLKAGGLLVVQIAPLYFSPDGCHLWEVGFVRWEHLTMQLNDLRMAIEKSVGPERSAGVWSMVESLNRITADQLIRNLEKCGFKLLKEQRVMADFDPPADLCDVYKIDVLKTKSILSVFQKEL
jgi:SAM-dependent methyltransferase